MARIVKRSTKAGDRQEWRYSPNRSAARRGRIQVLWAPPQHPAHGAAPEVGQPCRPQVGAPHQARRGQACWLRHTATPHCGRSTHSPAGRITAGRADQPLARTRGQGTGRRQRVSQATGHTLASPRRPTRAGRGRERRGRGHLAEPVRTVARHARRRATLGHVQSGVPHPGIASLYPPSRPGPSYATLTSILDLQPS